MILGYSEQRAKKDAHNREKGIKRLKKEYKSGSITKDKINKRGYNKFLEMSDNVEVEINYNKIVGTPKIRQQNKGFFLNDEYSELWQVERF